MKLAIVEAMFPELKGGSIYKTSRAKGSNPRVAIARAIGGVLKQVKGKRWTCIKATITCIDEIPEPTVADEQHISQ